MTEFWVILAVGLSALSIVVTIWLASRSDSSRKSEILRKEDRDDLRQELKRLETMVNEEKQLRKEQVDKITVRMDEIETNYNDKFKQVNDNIKEGTERIVETQEMLVEMKVNLRSFMKNQGYQYQEG